MGTHAGRGAVGDHEQSQRHNHDRGASATKYGPEFFALTVYELDANGTVLRELETRSAFEGWADKVAVGPDGDVAAVGPH